MSRQKLYRDQNKKECGNCHQIKPIGDFSKRVGRLRHICEECRIKINNISNFKKQLDVSIPSKKLLIY